MITGILIGLFIGALIGALCMGILAGARCLDCDYKKQVEHIEPKSPQIRDPRREWWDQCFV